MLESLKFDADEEALIVRVSSSRVPQANLILRYSGMGCFLAPYMAASLNEEVREFIAKKMKLAYEEGYRDGKWHQRKATAFIGGFETAR